MNLLAFFFVIPLRFERKTHALEGRCSIQLSYGTSLNCGAKVRFFTNIANFCITFFCYLCIKGSFVIYKVMISYFHKQDIRYLYTDTSRHFANYQCYQL